MSKFLMFIFSFCTCFFASGQLNYPNLSELEKNMDDLVKKFPSLCKKEKIGQSASGKPIYVLKIGSGGEELKPGIFIAAGVDGSHISGVYQATKIAEQILTSNDSVWIKFKSNNYLYVLPVLNVDAYSAAFSKPQEEVFWNSSSVDVDKDGRSNEDPAEDLNKDGWITHMRIPDPSGNWVQDSTHPFLLVEWDKKDYSKTRYRLFTEGVDNDRDGAFNEDGPGGVDLNLNFSFNYPSYQGRAGLHAMSESEARTIADYLFDRYNIYAVITLGQENTLSDPVKFDKQKNVKRIIGAPLEKDGAVNELVSEWYKKSNALPDPLPMAPKAGSFSQWAYFHYGRYSFSTPGWIAPVLKESSNPAEEGEKKESDKKEATKGKKEGGKDNYDLRYIKWADSMKIRDYFLPWAAYAHPDFPNQTLEIGGFKPYVRYNPPVEYLDSAVLKHVKFIGDLVQSMPVLAFTQVKTEALGNEIFRVSGKIVNTGKLPTHTELGDKTRWVRKIRHRIQPAANQTLVINKEKEFITALASGESREFSWLVKGKGELILEVASPMTGVQTFKVNLK
jgi:hypothetical protein